MVKQFYTRQHTIITITTDMQINVCHWYTPGSPFTNQNLLGVLLLIHIGIEIKQC